MYTDKKYEKGFGIVAIIWIVAALVVVGGSTYYMSQSANLEIDENVVEIHATTTVETSAKVALKDLIGKNVQCTFDNVYEGTKIKGVAYIAGESIRVDSTMVRDGSVIAETHMIMSGGDAYAWSSAGAGAGQGVKLKVDASALATTDQQYDLGLNEQFNYDCRDWKSDQGKFVAPTNISFADFAEAMNSNIKVDANVTGEVNQCGACDMIPDANAKAQCKVSLGCK